MKKIIYLISIVIVISSCNTPAEKPVEEKKVDSIVEIPEKKMYGIVIDTFLFEHGEVENNKSLGQILAEMGVDGNTIHKISVLSDTVFDLRKIKAGNSYTSMYSKDTLQKLKYFIYEINQVDFMVIDLVDSVRVYKDKKEVKIIEKVGEGIITTSLWNTMVEQKINPVLALDLSDIYAWTIDFFGLQTGDSFKVVYDEEIVDTVNVGINKIKYAEFTHYGKKIYAIPFMQDSVLSFYDENGQSLRKAFLKAPLRFSRISSRYSNSRMHPVLRIARPHHGVDYAAPIGTPVVSIGDGVVLKKENSGGAGNMVKIRHNSIYTSAYLHLSKYGPGISVGSRVTQGQIIGYVGSSGLSTGPHLDFRVYKNGGPVDPLKVESPSVDPVHEKLMPEFNIVKDSVIKALNAI